MSWRPAASLNGYGQDNNSSRRQPRGVAHRRLALLDSENELTRRSDELARHRQDLPWVRIDKDYRFDTDHGSAGLLDFFGGRSQLIVYHFMYAPSCSSIAERLRWRADPPREP